MSSDKKPRELDFEYMRLIATTNDINYDQKTGKFTGLSGDRVLLKCSLDAYAALKQECEELKAKPPTFIKLDETSGAFSQTRAAIENMKMFQKEAIELRHMLYQAKNERDELKRENEKLRAEVDKEWERADFNYSEAQVAKEELASTRASLEKSRKHVEESENEIVELQAENNAARAEIEKLKGELLAEQIVTGGQAQVRKQLDAELASARAEIERLRTSITTRTEERIIIEKLRERLDAAKRDREGLLEALKPFISIKQGQVFTWEQIFGWQERALDAINKFGGEGRVRQKAEFYSDLEFRPEKRRYMFWLARIFGRRVMGTDVSDGAITETVGYMWRGRLWIFNTKRRSVTGEGRE